jgi:hypothetical protein
MHNRDSIVSKALQGHRPDIDDEQRVEFFTRPYAEYRTFPKDKPEPANDNGKHCWPVRDLALKNKLMDGRDEAETVALNIQALSILVEVHGLLEATNQSTFIAHNGTGVEDEGALYKSGFGQEVHLEEFPTERLKNLYEEGTEGPTSDGQPWKRGPCVLLTTGNALGQTIKKLHRVGALQFNELGHLTHYRSRGLWFRIVERTRGAKGGRRAKAANDNVPSLAGRTEATYSSSSPDGPATGHRPPQSSYDPLNHWRATERHKDEATHELAIIRGACGRRSYEALEDAAMGVSLDDIGGGPRGDKRASARGKTLVQVAIELLLERRAPKPASRPL